MAVNGGHAGTKEGPNWGQSNLVGALVEALAGALVGALVGTLVEPLVGPLARGSNFAFAALQGKGSYLPPP